jgi:hypothetical protein
LTIVDQKYERRWKMSERGMNGAAIGVNEAATEADEVRKKKFREEWEQTGGGQLCLAFYDAFKNYKDYLETHGGEALRPSGPINMKYEEHRVFQECLSTLESYKREREETLLRNLEKAQRAARCEHEFMSGEQCRAPRVRDKKLCRMHHGGRRQHSGGNQEIASSDYRWKTRLKADWASGIYDPASGMERNEDHGTGQGGVIGGGWHPMKCYILGLLR